MLWHGHGSGSSSGSALRTGSCRSAESRPKLYPGSKPESEPLLVELVASASRPWFASWAATFRDGRAISASAKPRPCWTVSISGFDVVYALLPASNGEQGRHDTLDCGSSVSVMILRPARQGILGALGGSAAQKLFRMPCPPLTSIAWDFLPCAAHPALDPTEPPCTDPYARWCDRESE